MNFTEQYPRLTTEAMMMAARHGETIYLEETKYGWRITTDPTNASVAIDEHGRKNYLK